MDFVEISKVMEDLVIKGNKRFELEIKMGTLKFNKLLLETNSKIAYHAVGVSENNLKAGKIEFRGLKKAEIIQDFDLDPNEVKIFMKETIVTEIK